MMPNEGSASEPAPALGFAERGDCLFIGLACHAQRRVPVAQLESLWLIRMRAYKTRPWLWCATSLVVFIVIGLSVRFDNKGDTISMARDFFEYFTGLLSGRDQMSAELFLGLAGWVTIAVAVGWFLHSLLVMLMTRHERLKSPA